MKRYKANGALIKSLRANRDENSMQKQFAHAIGVSERKLRKIENESDLITRKTAEALGKALNVPWHTVVYSADGPQLVQASPDSPSCVAAPVRRPETIFIPRYDYGFAHAVRDEAKLYEDAKSNWVVISHIQISLTSETNAYAEELLETLESLTYGRVERDDIIEGRRELALRRRMRELLVLLRGNDVWVYTTTHMKNLPESDVPVTKRCTEWEFQLVIAFGPPGEYGEETVKVPVDNGHPCTIPYAPILPPGVRNG